MSLEIKWLFPTKAVQLEMLQLENKRIREELEMALANQATAANSSQPALSQSEQD